MDFGSTAFWVALGQIIAIDILLAGDNAIVIALAARSLPPQHRRMAIMLGTAAAVVARIIFAALTVELLKLPYLKIIGGVLLLWIGIQLLVPEDEGDGEGVQSATSLWAAVRTIVIADVVMSLDNVIAIAAAAKGEMTLLVLGLLISIPLVVSGSAIILRLMDRFPIIITLGGALLGYVAGDMIAHDPLVAEQLAGGAAWLGKVPAIGGALLVVAVGHWLAARAKAKASMVDLAGDGSSPGKEAER